MATPRTEKERLFNAAAELTDPARRAVFLDAACGEDAALRAELEDLLRHDEAAGRFLQMPALAPGEGRPPGPGAGDTPTDAAGPGGAPAGDEPAATVESPGAGGEARGLSPPSIDEGPGTRIGPYKLLQKIDEGGMGVVYLAEQERPVRRKVALKIIKPGMDTGQVVARFEAERQALALMDHPNIAKVLDAGATGSGRPFFAMELVKGVPITEYCDQAQLTPRERLQLFVPVCQAIQHAHQKGIIHRDVKPSNVLVTLVDGRPTPRVIDFGIAKATDQRLTERTLFTQHGAIVGTLEYMSPEQAEPIAPDVDTRSDIYSLGVLLYELLTGTTPLERARLREVGYAEILRRIREEEPPRPSARLSDSGEGLASIAATRRTEPARLTRLVRGELDWIVMRALEKDRTRRYDSAGGFASDVEKYLADEPVEACPPSRRYRLGKIVRKHRAALATVGAFALLLIAATAVSLGLAHRAEQERIRAVKAEELAMEQKGRALERERMAIDAVKRFGDVIRATPELKNNPSLAPLRASLLREPQAFFKSLRDRLQEDRETTPDSLDRLAAACLDLGDLTLAIGDREDALPALEGSLAIRERLARENPSVDRFHNALANIHLRIAFLHHEMGRLAEALASLERAVAIQERLTRVSPSNTRFQGNLAVSHLNIGNVRSTMGQPAEALASYERARDLSERLVRENPSVIAFQDTLAGSLGSIGNMYRAGRPAEALASLERARTIYERLAREHPSDGKYQDLLARTHVNIGTLHSNAGRPGEALASYEGARAILEGLAREDPSVNEYRQNLARILDGIGAELRGAGRLAEAMESFERARTIYERLVHEYPELPDFADQLGSNLSNMAAIDLDQGRFEEARARLTRAIELQRKALARSPRHPGYRRTLGNELTNMVIAAEGLGRGAEAAAARGELAELAASDPAKVALDDRLAAVLKGQAPADDGERILLAARAYEKEWYATSARLSGEALANDPGLRDDRRAQHAYNAACVAALAGCGRGKDEPKPDEAAGTEHRRQAREWLRAELAAWAKVLDAGPAETRVMIVPTLRRWKCNPDLAGIRDDKELARLPQREVAEFKQIWHDVDQLLAKASGGK